MYRIDDRLATVKEMQRLLRYIGDSADIQQLKQVRRNGIYDEPTRKAVMYFQSENALNDSGKIDMDTFYALYDRYLFEKKRTENTKLISLSIDLPASYGLLHYDMIDINSMLSYVSEYYFGASDIIINSYFSLNTENAVKELQKSFLLTPDGVINDEFYIRLTEEYDSIKELLDFV